MQENEENPHLKQPICSNQSVFACRYAVYSKPRRETKI